MSFHFALMTQPVGQSQSEAAMLQSATVRDTGFACPALSGPKDLWTQSSVGFARPRSKVSTGWNSLRSRTQASRHALVPTPPPRKRAAELKDDFSGSSIMHRSMSSVPGSQMTLPRCCKMQLHNALPARESSVHTCPFPQNGFSSSKTLQSEATKRRESAGNGGFSIAFVTLTSSIDLIFSSH